ncbi:Diacylglycerol kinase [Roseibium album]|nr:Diacylglycerol kinase [Roseibium album]
MRIFQWSATPLEPSTIELKNTGSALIMANPTSGGYSAKTLKKVKARLEELGWTAEIRLTSSAGEIGEVCTDPSLDVRTLVIAGGDGSINEAIIGLQDHPHPPQLAVVPIGTANVLALELSLPRKANAIAETIARQKTKRLHFGLANGHPFLLMASAGFDAEVVHSVPLALKRRLGKLAYVFTAFKVGLTRKDNPLQITLDGEPFAGKFAVASNARHYGGPFVICPSEVTDPGLHMLILEKDDLWSSINYGIALMLGRIHKARGATVKPFTAATISAQSAVATQVDGDPFGATPVEIRQADKTIPILVP